MSYIQDSKEPAAKSTDAVSALSPVDPSSVSSHEEEKSAPWIVRKLVGSITGRIVMSSYETFRAAGTSVVCLSPWGDSSPLLLPCIRFRDLALHVAITATGGMAAVAAPIMGPVSDVVVSTLGSSIIVEGGLHLGFDLGSKVLDDLIIDKPVNAMIPLHDKRLETTKVSSLLITLKYHHTVEDAALGFYRSSLHKESSLFSSVKDYLGVEKGWFSPYLFASGRRPIIPRTLKPDVVFCHGPFLLGDYKIGETLLAESASMISLCPEPIPSGTPSPSTTFSKSRLSMSSIFHRESDKLATPSSSPGPDPADQDSTLSVIQPPPPRRMVILLIGLKPHRSLWSTSARPSESVIYYQLLNGVPAIVLPVKPGAPLVAWDGLTLEQLWKIDVNKSEGQKGGIFGIISVLSEFLEFCVDFDRVLITRGAESVETAAADENHEEALMTSKRMAIRNALTIFIVSAVRSGESKEVKKEIDRERSGIAMWRIP